MSDNADLANLAIERTMNLTLINRQSDMPVASGFCHYCGEPVAGDLRWCDVECRDAWQAEQDARQRNGVAS